MIVVVEVHLLFVLRMELQIQRPPPRVTQMKPHAE